MVGLSFAAVPFYRAFCQATGFNGTVRRGLKLPRTPSSQTVLVRFDTNVDGLPWKFKPVQMEQRVRLGAANDGPRPITGRALYNVLPETAGAYSSKLECFCFHNQPLGRGETMEFPVVYFVDPRYARDGDEREAGQITLSYTFFPASTPRVGR